MSDSAARPSKFRRIAPTGALGLLWTAAPITAGFLLLGYLGAVGDWLNARDELGPIIYTVGFMLACGFGLLPTYAQSILGGWVFGLAAGFPYALIGFTGGSVIGYLIAKGVSRHEVEKLIDEVVRARAVRDALIGHGFWRTLGTIALLRLPPNSPFALTNLAMAAAGVRLAPFVPGTLLGMAPRTGLAVFLAATAAETGARDIQTFAGEKGTWVVIAGIAVAVIVIAIMGAIANRALKRLTPTATASGDRAAN